MEEDGYRAYFLPSRSSFVTPKSGEAQDPTKESDSEKESDSKKGDN